MLAVSYKSMISQKSLFSLPDNVSYLNCAYMGPQLKSVEAVGIESVKRKALPFEISPEDFFTQVTELKKAYARIINIEDHERIAIVPSASYGINNAANNIDLQSGQNIILAGEQFPSNYYPWEKLADSKKGELRIINAPQENVNRGQLWNQRILESIDYKTAVVALGHVHWADGTQFDLQKIRERTNEVGAALVIDGSQSVGALPLDVSVLQPDALVNVGYKWLLGPYGMAMAYYGPRFDNGQPIEENWINRLNSEDFKNLVNYQSAYKPKANRYMVGENSQFIHAPMQTKALNQILDWGINNINQYCKDLTEEPVAKLRAMGCFIEDEENRAHHLLGIRTNGLFNIESLKSKLEEKSVFVSFRGDAIRVSTNVFNEAKDFEKLISCFESLS